MATKFFDFDSIVSYDSILNVDDLKLKSKASINPPPRNGRCMCCGKHLRELQLFQNPLKSSSGKQEKAKLRKNFRPISPYKYKNDTELKNALVQIFKLGYYKVLSTEVSMDLFVKFGKRKGVFFVGYLDSDMDALFLSSWECKDCFYLIHDDYHKILKNRIES